jgi:hypothetical protein
MPLNITDRVVFCWIEARFRGLCTAVFFQYVLHITPPKIIFFSPSPWNAFPCKLLQTRKTRRKLVNRSNLLLQYRQLPTQNFSWYFEVYLDFFFFAGFWNFFYIFIPRFFAEPSKRFFGGEKKARIRWTPVEERWPSCFSLHRNFCGTLSQFVLLSKCSET